MIPLWGRFEARCTASHDREDPLSGPRAVAEFRHESGATGAAEAFWNGQREWLVRFSPDREGRWTYRCECPGDEGLSRLRGAFECGGARPENPLDRHGPIRVAARQTHFEHADGTPLFWLGDTSWNGPLKSSAGDWDLYLADRREKGFTAIQFVITQWLAAAGDAEGRRAWNGKEPPRIDPAYFRRMDARVDAINRQGMIAAPVLAWAADWNKDALDLNPGTALSDAGIAALARYIVARYGAHHTVWILAGDGDYRGERADRWRQIGREVFAGSDRIVTMHPGGRVWVAKEFAEEPWYRFNGYQSGHWRDESEQWITQGPPSLDWKRSPVPHVNLEFCYEAHEDFVHHLAFDAADVRRSAWWSVLAAPLAGVSYGCHGIWSWESEPGHPMNHPNTGAAPCWRDALALPGSVSMHLLRQILERVEWWRLSPCPELAAGAAPGPHIAAAISDSSDTAVVFVPDGREVPVGAVWSVSRIDAATGLETGERARDCVLILRRNP